MACDLHVINKIIASFSLDFDDDDDDDISHRSIYLYVCIYEREDSSN